MQRFRFFLFAVFNVDSFLHFLPLFAEIGLIGRKSGCSKRFSLLQGSHDGQGTTAGLNIHGNSQRGWSWRFVDRPLPVESCPSTPCS
jgi:hypothetical protein